MRRLSRNVVVASSCAAFVAGMVGLSYAAAPLYEIFCRATGYAGTPKRAAGAPAAAGDGFVTVRFDTNVDPALPWSFQPEQRSVRVRVGEPTLVYFRAANRDAAPVTGHASFNVAPDLAGRYFSKLQCFCFTEQRLAPGETVDMPVSFFVDPQILKDREGRGIGEITLSYTFYRSAAAKTAAVEAGGKS
jgi:cytochrome c oxidase assembly protein subunit 11